jgi:hypothetical protein
VSCLSKISPDEIFVGYKIRRKKDGLFSLGGNTPTWSRYGKTWSSLNAFSNHVAVIREYGKDPLTVYKDCEMVLLGITATQTMESYVRE